MIDTGELALVEAARADSESFAALYDRYRDPIHTYICRRVGSCHEAEEIVAQVFETALRGLPRYEYRSVPFGAWLYRIASNKIADHLRQHYRHPTEPLDGIGALADKAPGPAEQLDASEEQAALRRALSTLSPADQLVISLTFFEERPRSEVAAALGCSVDTVYVRLHRALRRLRAALEKQGEVIYV
ncbi:MAG: RNA polymerase sigma factor [Herpetosiphonaceae bacterium]|nr:MAG: RNA polymerase sigma factor [Herpetosiphonaceae bacterium]